MIASKQRDFGRLEPKHGVFQGFCSLARGSMATTDTIALDERPFGFDN